MISRVPVSAAWCILGLRMEEQLPIWRVAVYIYVIRSRRLPTMDGAPIWGLDKAPATPHPKTWPGYDLSNGKET